jgi:quercetin dioxygenase-like cupin family protein
MKPTDETLYPDFIRGLPQVDIVLSGVRGWLLQSETTQAVFFDIEPVAVVPPHSHCAQWGIMLEGEMKLTIGGETRLIRKGDRYFIPNGVTHSAVFLTRVQVIDIFDDPNRYRAK